MSNPFSVSKKEKVHHFAAPARNNNSSSDDDDDEDDEQVDTAGKRTLSDDEDEDDTPMRVFDVASAWRPSNIFPGDDDAAAAYLDTGDALGDTGITPCMYKMDTPGDDGKAKSPEEQARLAREMTRDPDWAADYIDASVSLDTPRSFFFARFPYDVKARMPRKADVKRSVVVFALPSDCFTTQQLLSYKERTGMTRALVLTHDAAKACGASASRAYHATVLDARIVDADNTTPLRLNASLQTLDPMECANPNPPPPMDKDDEAFVAGESGTGAAVCEATKPNAAYTSLHAVGVDVQATLPAHHEGGPTRFDALATAKGTQLDLPEAYRWSHVSFRRTLATCEVMLNQKRTAYQIPVRHKDHTPDATDDPHEPKSLPALLLVSYTREVIAAMHAVNAEVDAHNAKLGAGQQPLKHAKMPAASKKTGTLWLMDRRVFRKALSDLLDLYNPPAAQNVNLCAPLRLALRPAAGAREWGMLEVLQQLERVQGDQKAHRLRVLVALTTVPTPMRTQVEPFEAQVVEAARAQFADDKAVAKHMTSAHTVKTLVARLKAIEQ